MGIGGNGAHTASVQDHVERECRVEQEHATILHLQGVGSHAKVPHNRIVSVTKRLVQSLEIGVHGLHSVHALSPVVLACKHEQENVTVLLLPMVVQSVLVLTKKIRSAKIFRVQLEHGQHGDLTVDVASLVVVEFKCASERVQLKQ